MSKVVLRKQLPRALGRGLMRSAMLAGVVSLNAIFGPGGAAVLGRLLSSPAILFLLGFTALFFTALDLWMQRALARWEQSDPEARAHLTNAQIEQLTRPGWFRRGVRLPMLTASVIAVPVALFLSDGLAETPAERWVWVGGALLASFGLSSLITVALRPRTLRALKEQ